MSDFIYNHYRKEELLFAKTISHLVELCNEKQQMKLTDFIDPYKQKIVMDFCNRFSNLQCILDGGFESAERKRALIIPDDWEYSDEDFKIQTLTIYVTDPKAKLKHGDFLGAVLGLGIKREKIGDLILLDNTCFLSVDETIADYILLQLTHVSRHSVTVKEVSSDEIPVFEKDLLIVSNTVSSIRLDSILKAAYNISRTKSAELIKKGLVKHNWCICNEPARSVSIGDVISCKGYARIKVLQVLEPNKKGRIPIQIGKYQ